MKKVLHNLLLVFVVLSCIASPTFVAADTLSEDLNSDQPNQILVTPTAPTSDPIQDLTAPHREAIKVRQGLDVQFIAAVASDTKWRVAKILFYKAFQPTAKAFLQNYFEMSEACAEVVSHVGLLALHRRTPVFLYADYKPADYSFTDRVAFWDAALYSLNNGHIVNTCLRDAYQGAFNIYGNPSGFQVYADRVQNNLLANATSENSFNGLMDVAYNGGNYLVKSITPQEYYQSWTRLTNEPFSNALEVVVWLSSWANPFSWWDWGHTVFSTNTTSIAPTNNREGFVWDVGVKAYDVSAATLGWCFSWFSLKAWSYWLGELAGEFSMGYSSVQENQDSSKKKN